MSRLRDLPKLRDSLSYLYLEHTRVERKSHAIAALDPQGELHVPAAALGVLMLGPGTTVTHGAMSCLAESGVSVLWVGEDGLRYYAQGMGETRSAARLLRQASLHADPVSRMAVVVKMYEHRFADPLEPGLTLEQIRGKEGVRVRTAYSRASRHTGVAWHGRSYDRGDWYRADPINRALSSAASCLYGICHCAIVSAGYSPALGFIHSGKQLSFVYDVADLYRADVVIPTAFEVTARFQQEQRRRGLSSEVRRACREAFREHDILGRVVRDLDRLIRVDDAERERAEDLLDGDDDPPWGLWDPGQRPVPGGINHGRDPA